MGWLRSQKECWLRCQAEGDARGQVTLEPEGVDRANHGGRASPKDWAFVVGAALLFLGAIALSVFAIVSLFRAIF